MRAAMLHDLNQTLSIETVADPTPTAADALVRIRACGVNFADTLMVKGRYQEKPPLPFAPGMEIAGVVESCPPDADHLAEGSRVIAVIGHGGFADYAAIPAESCIPIPEGMSFSEAAGFMIAYGTSDIALVERAALRPEETLLVLGASGGVGLTAVEIGRVLGANVIACARGPEKLEIATSAGADHVIDSDDGDLRHRVKALGGADVVYDPVGDPLFSEAMRACNPGARLLPLGFAAGQVPQIPANYLLVKNLTVHGLYWGGYRTLDPALLRRSLERLLAWYADGRIRPHISAEVPLERAEDALDMLRKRTATGKVVIVM